MNKTLADLGEELNLGTRHQHCMSFLLLRHQPEGRLQSNHGAGHLNLQKLRHSGLKHQSIEFGSATATGNLREEISERRVSEKGSSNFSV